MQKPGFGRRLTATVLVFLCFGLLLAGVLWVSREGIDYRTLQGMPRQEQSDSPIPDQARVVAVSLGDNAVWMWGLSLILGLAVIWLMVLSRRRQMQIKRESERRQRQVCEYDRLVYSLCGILEDWDEDPSPKKHVLRVARYARILAGLCGMPEEKVERIGVYAMLHDIGMVYVPRSILRKSGPLTPEEYARIKKHVDHGYGLATRYGLPPEACHVIRYHHEQWDGNGYHKGLSGSQIPLEARIVCLADTYDALRMERVYRPSYTHQEAVEVILEERGRMLDPALVDLFYGSHGLFEKAFDEDGPGGEEETE